MKKAIIIFLLAGGIILMIFSAKQKESVFPFREVRLETNLDQLGPEEKITLYRLVRAATIVDRLFFRQVDRNNYRYKEEIEKKGTAEQKRLLLINFGPFDRLKVNQPFFKNYLKSPGAGFYPPNLTREEFESYLKNNPQQNDELISAYTIVERSGEKLIAVPYHRFFKAEIEELCSALEHAAESCTHLGLKKYLQLRAVDLKTDDYFQSDCAWLEIENSLLEMVIGPYEVYEDELFNYKAAYEAFVGVNDLTESKKVEKLISMLPEIQNNLPVERRYISTKIGALSPIRVCQLVYSAGDSKAGINTIAFALPNDERVRQQKGSKKVILKNVIRAKFTAILEPIARILIDKKTLRLVSFDGFYYHTILHELSHPLGTDYIYPQEERKQSVRIALKETYSAIEEAKADVVGQWAALYLVEKEKLQSELAEQIAATQLASMFRSMRFSTTQAHGLANLIQLNFLLEKGAVRFNNGRYALNYPEYKKALTELAKILLTIEGQGSYQQARQLIDRYGTLNRQIKNSLRQLRTIAVDIQPVFVTLRQLAMEFKDPLLEKDYHF